MSIYGWKKIHTFYSIIVVIAVFAGLYQDAINPFLSWIWEKSKNHESTTIELKINKDIVNINLDKN